MRRNSLLESLDSKVGKSLVTRRYALSDMISESYKALYDCKEGTNLQKLAEAHLQDVRENPSDTERLSRQLSLVKELIRMTECGDLSDADLVEKKYPARRKGGCDASNHSVKRPMQETAKRKRVAEAPSVEDLDEADELTDEEVEELAKHLEEIRKKKGVAPKKEEVTEDASPRKGIRCTTHESKDTKEEDLDEASSGRIAQIGIDIAVPDDIDTKATEDKISSILQDAGYDVVGCMFSDTSWSKEEYGISESKDSPYAGVREGLAKFGKASSSKAFYKTFKKMHESLKEGKALTRQESMNLYKAANSAMTQLSVELEHNPEFLSTFSECTSILSSDVARLLESMKRGKAPSKKNMKSLANFYESILNEADEDEEEEIPEEDIEDTEEVEDDEFIGDDEGDMASEEEEDFDQEYADARVEMHKELVATHGDSEDPGVQEKIEQDAAEVLELPGITDEQIAEIQGEESEDAGEEEEPAEDEEEIPDESEEDSLEDEEVTDEELEELKKHLQEMRAAKSLKEASDDLFSKVEAAIKDAGISYRVTGNRNKSIVVDKSQLKKASEIRNKIDPEYTVSVKSPV